MRTLLPMDEINKLRTILTESQTVSPQGKRTYKNRKEIYDSFLEMLEIAYAAGVTDAVEQITDKFGDASTGAWEDKTGTRDVGKSGKANMPPAPAGKKGSGKVPEKFPSSSDKVPVSSATDITFDTDRRDEVIGKKLDDGKDWRQRVGDHLDNGDSVDQIMVAAESESNRVANTGSLDKAKADGRFSRKTWVTMMDDRVRDTHDYLEGVKVGINDRFYTFDGDSAEMPGDFMLPQNNVNCRCALKYD